MLVELMLTISVCVPRDSDHDTSLLYPVSTICTLSIFILGKALQRSVFDKIQSPLDILFKPILLCTLSPAEQVYESFKRLQRLLQREFVFEMEKLEDVS